MSIPTVNEIALSIMKEFGEDTSNSDLLVQVEEWIKNVYDEIGIQTKWKYLWLAEAINTIIGERSYALVGAFSDHFAAQYNGSGNAPLIYKNRSEMMNLSSPLTMQTGKPKYWYINSYDSVTERFIIRLYPIPDAIYQISFYGILMPQELVSTTKLPMPKEFIFVLKDGVRYRYKMDDKDFSGADRFDTKFKANINLLKQRNDMPVALKQRMYIQDISSGNDPLVRFPPDHFRN